MWDPRYGADRAEASWEPVANLRTDDCDRVLLNDYLAMLQGYFVASGRERFGCENLLAALEGSGLECPTVGAALLGRWFPAPAEA